MILSVFGSISAKNLTHMKENIQDSSQEKPSQQNNSTSSELLKKYRS